MHFKKYFKSMCVLTANSCKRLHGSEMYRKHMYFQKPQASPRGVEVVSVAVAPALFFLPVSSPRSNLRNCLMSMVALYTMGAHVLCVCLFVLCTYHTAICAHVSSHTQCVWRHLCRACVCFYEFQVISASFLQQLR